ncbi:MAG: DUF4406 domain-containing protein [Synergistaceae bacterium]|nr:DUF4406 domain-containing protein [Synergistaceae bacterium]
MENLKKTVYLCHPLRGAQPHTREKTEKNITKATAICRAIAQKGEVALFSPLHAFSFLDPLTVPYDDAMQYCFLLLSTCDEMWVCPGDKTSQGCLDEIRLARRLGIITRYLSLADLQAMNYEPD